MLHVCYFFQSNCQEYNLARWNRRGDSSRLTTEPMKIIRPSQVQEGRQSQSIMISSFLKHQPLSKPSLLVIEGTASSQQCIIAFEASADHECAFNAQPQPGTSSSLVPVIEPEQAPPPDQSPEPGPIHDFISTPPPPPAKTQKRMRPASDKKEIFDIQYRQVP
ncbi:hypothetical protein E2C01_056255 [Portunus trituberculatus]|uniref:Uncharacterized protein n=1 Tax=Portunus trituberculatus TaxID=210409 RepID=A0A5B7GTL4_PORTR|nr:hypothetical protein [Portunus trituberculatus]